MVTSDFRPEVEIQLFHACAMKIYHITLIYGRIAEIFASFRKSGSRNMMVTSDFRPEMEIWPFRACTMKNTQCNPYLWPNRRNFRVFQEIGVEEHHPVSVEHHPVSVT